MIKKLSSLFVLLFLYSCQKFSGKIRFQGDENSSQSVILINTSNDKKLKFTIKKDIKYESGKQNSVIVFYELEPGDETIIGETISFSPKEFYTKVAYDTIKKYIHFDQVLKQTNSNNWMSKKLAVLNKKKYVYSPNYYTTFKKNGLVYDPTTSPNGGINVFWGSDWKSIDTTKSGNTQTITYLELRTVSDSTKPKKQEKTVYSYEIKGQRVIN